MRASAIAIPLVLCAACGAAPSSPGDDVSPGDDLPGDDMPGDDGPPGCSEAPTCVAWNQVGRCGEVTTCTGGCFAGECVPDRCADECTPGEAGPSGSCRLWDMASGAFVAPDPAGSLVDRARDYDRIQRASHLPEGGVAEAVYTDASLAQLQGYGGIVDSALWTGTLLAAHSWRHLVTRSPDSAARIAATARTLHVWFNVSSSPGYLARFAVPEGSPVPIEMDCSRRVIHCDAVFDGTTYRWRGDTSRDQYTGVMLGLVGAYLATPDPAVRADIRADVMELVEQLMIERVDVPVRVTIDGLPIDTTLDSKYIILAPEEMTDGRVTMDIDTGDVADAQLDGAREFVPDVGPIITQVIGFSPGPIPRPGSAMMLGAFYRMALLVSDGVPELAARRAAIQADYDAAFDELATLASGGHATNECGGKYYGHHIDYIMGYAWTVLEDDPARKARLRDDMMSALWADVEDHDNVYFALLDAGSRGLPSAGTAVDHLAQFQPGPRVHLGRDNLAGYPHDTSCSDGGYPQSAVAVSVGDRAIAEFMWQRHPWRLVDYADPDLVEPGVDFLAPYWLARLHGFVADDRPGTCGRWE
jgi:hypothetical protein